MKKRKKNLNFCEWNDRIFFEFHSTLSHVNSFSISDHTLIFIFTWFKSFWFFIYITFSHLIFSFTWFQIVILNVKKKKFQLKCNFSQEFISISYTREHLSADWRMERHIDIIKHWFWCSDLLLSTVHIYIVCSCPFFTSLLYSNLIVNFYIVLHWIDWNNKNRKTNKFQFCSWCQDQKVHQFMAER